MKRLFIILLFSVNILNLHSQIDGYVLIFTDEFNTFQGNEIYKHDQHCILASDLAFIDNNPVNYQTSSGKLYLDAIYTPGKIGKGSCMDKDANIIRDYTYKNLRTRRNYKYGRFKIRALIPKGGGLFPAFWLFGGSSDPSLDHTEIDIFEIWTLDEDAKSQIWLWHGNGASDHSHKWWGWQPNSWHTYTLDWRPDYLKVFYDDICVATLNNSFGHGNMDVLIGNQISSHGGNPNPSEFPLTMVLDYFTVEYPIDVDEIISVENWSNLNHENTVFAGKQITMANNNGSVVLSAKPNSWDDPVCLDLVATESIVLKPGFKAEATSEFRAWIVDGSNFKNGESESAGKDNKYKINWNLLDTSMVSQDSKDINIIENNSSLSNEFQVEVFPNPTESFLNISMNKFNEIQRIEIFDRIGSLYYYSDEGFTSEQSINTNKWPPGLYILRIMNDSGIIITKRIIKK